jgi:DNA modification methylase
MSAGGEVWWERIINKTMNKIFNEDFRNHLSNFNSNAYVISDPPYNQKYHYSLYSDDMDIDEYGTMLRDAFSGQKSVIISYPEETLNIVSRTMTDDVCEQSVAWVYNSNTAKQHRLVTWWNCKPDMRKIGQPYKNPTDKRIAKRISEGKEARLYDWWEINQVKNVSKKDNPHPCPIPYELAKRIILLTVPEKGLVIDPFAGSGTILQAAKDTGREYLGFEIDKTYYEYMKNISL